MGLPPLDRAPVAARPAHTRNSSDRRTSFQAGRSACAWGQALRQLLHDAKNSNFPAGGKFQICSIHTFRWQVFGIPVQSGPSPGCRFHHIFARQNSTSPPPSKAMLGLIPSRSRQLAANPRCGIFWPLRGLMVPSSISSWNRSSASDLQPAPGRWVEDHRA